MKDCNIEGVVLTGRTTEADNAIGQENVRRHPGRPMKFPSVELLQEKIDEYFNMCDSHMKKILTKGGRVVDVSDPLPYTLSGLAVHLKCNRDTLLEYSHKDPFSGAIKTAKQRCEADSEQRLFTHFTLGVIFSLKNNYRWRDKIEIDATQNMTIQVVPQRAFVEE